MIGGTLNGIDQFGGSAIISPNQQWGERGHVEEIAAMVAFVAGPEFSYITGASLTVDGGMNA